MIGQTVSQYRVLSKLGGGGMGVVYEAEDLNLIIDDAPAAAQHLSAAQPPGSGVMKRAFKRLAAFVLLWLAVPSVALAQETTTGSIAGRVLDPQGAVVPEASVTLRSGQGARSLATDAHGQFLAPYLTPGLYTVRVERPGFKPLEQRDVRVRLGQRVELDYTLGVGDFQELVEVTAAAPVVDTRSTTAGAVLDSDELLRLPVGRRLTSTLYMVPGVSNSSGTGDSNPSIAGASGLDNHYVVDGVNITNTGFGGIGVYTFVFGSLGTGVTTDFIQETQVKTAGFEAEYGQTTGGVVNVITRSGSNAFHGSLFGYFRPSGLEGGWRQQQTETGQVNTTRSQDLDVGIRLGGPLLKDRLFFFGAFNPQYETRTLIAPEGFPLSSLREVDRKRRSLSYAGKLTWQLKAQHRFDLTAFGDPSHGEPGPQRPGALLAQDTDQFSELRSYGGHNQALRYSGVLGPKWWLEVTAAQARTRHVEEPSVDEWRVTDFSVVPAVRSGGLGRHQAGNEGRNAQLALKSTQVLGGGAHELRYGIQLEDIEYTAIANRTGPSLTFPDRVPSRTGVTVTVRPDPVYGRIHTADGSRGDPPVTTQKYLSWFVQDTWRVGSRLTLRPGIRWERERIAGGLPLCYSDESGVGAGDGTPGNEINCAYTWTNNWGPRLGATFDILGSGRSKLYASWGRYYAKIPNELAARAMGSESTASADYFDAELTRPVPDGVLARRTTDHFRLLSGRPSQFASGSRSTYHDELLAGFEIEAAPALSLGVRYVHRSLANVLEDYSQAQPVLYNLDFKGLDEVTYLIGNIHAGIKTIDATSIGVPRAFFEDPVHTYDAVELTAQKSFSNNWSLFASYRWSRLRGNYDGFYRADNGGSAPALDTLFDFPTNDPSYTEIGVPQFGYRGDIRYLGTTLGQGLLPNDRTHQLKLYGARAWRDLTAGLAFRAGSGQPLTALAANPAYDEPYDIPETLRGAGFETTDGFRRRAPAEVLLDLHLDYTIRFGAGRRLVLVADVFNVLDDRDPVSYDSGTEVLFGVPNPAFGTPRNPADPASPFETPRQVRLGARLEW